MNTAADAHEYAGRAFNSQSPAAQLIQTGKIYRERSKTTLLKRFQPASQA